MFGHDGFRWLRLFVVLLLRKKEESFSELRLTGQRVRVFVKIQFFCCVQQPFGAFFGLEVNFQSSNSQSN